MDEDGRGAPLKVGPVVLDFDWVGHLLGEAENRPRDELVGLELLEEQADEIREDEAVLVLEEYQVGELVLEGLEVRLVSDLREEMLVLLLDELRPQEEELRLSPNVIFRHLVDVSLDLLDAVVFDEGDFLQEFLLLLLEDGVVVFSGRVLEIGREFLENAALELLLDAEEFLLEEDRLSDVVHPLGLFGFRGVLRLGQIRIFLGDKIDQELEDTVPGSVSWFFRGVLYRFQLLQEVLILERLEKFNFLQIFLFVFGGVEIDRGKCIRGGFQIGLRAVAESIIFYKLSF